MRYGFIDRIDGVDQALRYSVRYEAVNAMLLNEFLKEHCRVREQERKIQEQEATNAGAGYAIGTPNSATMWIKP
jgi:hypothetical protein